MFQSFKTIWKKHSTFLDFITPFSKNLGIRIAAVILAFICWGAVKSMEKTTKTITVPLKLKTADGYEAVARTTNDAPVQFITLNILTPRREYKTLRKQDYDGVIDLTAETENVIPSYVLNSKENLVYKGPDENKDLYFIESIKPAKIRIIIDKKTYKNLSVTPVVKGKPADGYVLSKITVNPPVVVVNGPASSVEKIAELKTKPINIDSLNKSLVKNIEIESAGPDIVLETAKVKVNIGINTAPKQRTFNKIKVKKLVSQPADTFYMLDPQDISVILEGRDQIINTTLPKDIKAFVDLAGATPGYALLVSVIPPANCNVVSVMPSTVTVKENITQGGK